MPKVITRDQDEIERCNENSKRKGTSTLKPTKKRKANLNNNGTKLKPKTNLKQAKIKKNSKILSSSDGNKKHKDTNIKKTKLKKKSAVLTESIINEEDSEGDTSNSASINGYSSHEDFDESQITSSIVFNIKGSNTVTSNNKGPNPEKIDMSSLAGEESDISLGNDDSIEVLSNRKKRLMLDVRVGADNELSFSKERNLRIIATQGVVQLFQVINEYQCTTIQDVSEAATEAQREKVLGAGKDMFMSLLNKHTPTNMEGVKEEVKDEKKTTWNVFSDNFYKETAKAGWDKDSD